MVKNYPLDYEKYKNRVIKLFLEEFDEDQIELASNRLNNLLDNYIRFANEIKSLKKQLILLKKGD